MEAIDAGLLAKTLGFWACRAESLASVLRVAKVRASALEASVRGGAKGILGQRMMLESIDSMTALAVLTSLGFDLSDSIVLRAVHLGSDLPSIGGWDASRERLVGKLYINASDAGQQRRERLTRALDVPAHERAPHVITPHVITPHVITPHVITPHVIGFNLHLGEDGSAYEVETKFYDQWANARALADADIETPAFFKTLIADTSPAGLVRCQNLDEEGGLTTKAWFVAPRPRQAHLLLGRLTHFAEDAVAHVLPYAPGPIKSIGMSADGSQWTVYFKPAGSVEVPWSLEPLRSFASSSGEVGLFLSPNEHATQAYCRTAQHALLYRVRDGQPPPKELDVLMLWAKARLEECADEVSSEVFDGPPEPWRAVT